MTHHNDPAVIAATATIVEAAIASGAYSTPVCRMIVDVKRALLADPMAEFATTEWHRADEPE